LFWGITAVIRQVGERVLAGQGELKASENAWDWLGNGFYFWENNPRRAREWAQSVKRNPSLSKARGEQPFAMGAILDLGAAWAAESAVAVATGNSANEPLLVIVIDISPKFKFQACPLDDGRASVRKCPFVQSASVPRPGLQRPCRRKIWISS